MSIIDRIALYASVLMIATVGVLILVLGTGSTDQPAPTYSPTPDTSNVNPNPNDGGFTDSSYEYADVPCANEDGSGGTLPCYWDAQSRANGEGRSFTINSDGSYRYWDE